MGGEKSGHATAEYRAWHGMKTRCTNSRRPDWKNYGGRGITICERWANSFEAFLADMGRKPSPKHTIDRIDNDGNYEPGNCRWATRSEQQANKRPRVPVTGSQDNIRFEFRLADQRRRELAELAADAELSSADLVRLSIGWLLQNPGVLLPSVAARREAQTERVT